ncbi:MAG: type I secretion system permease/ATPase [Hyphomicrobiales bacterium]|nr:MAG: type I secretion system permease/ATPase [Hyphomicrobiales bacterium]
MSKAHIPLERAPRQEGLFALLAHAGPSARKALAGIAAFSGLINILALTSSLYMLQLYDRVIPSHSVPTLIGLSLIMLVLFAGYGLLDVIRAKLMARVGLEIDRTYRSGVYRLLVTLPLKAANTSDTLQPVRDLDQVRSFVAGAGPIALFDFPWMPFYLGLVFLLHPWLGLLALAGAVILVVLTLLTDLRSRTATREATVYSAVRLAFADASRRNAEAIVAMGMGTALAQRWSHRSEDGLVSQIRGADIAATYGTLSKVLRYVLQSAVLGLGAYLTINGQATGGVMIAASILTSRALAPVEIAIANWRSFLAARASAQRLDAFFKSVPEASDRLVLPAPTKSLSVDSLFVAGPGQSKPILQNISFGIQAGTALGIIGPSASGKTTLARAIVGAWTPMRGSVRLDNATLDQWPLGTIGRHVGYLPQDIELFDGTVAQNIARFSPGATSEAVVAAAKLACVHDMIVGFSNGYETHIGEGGAVLSAGQRQRLALARALYGDPFLVVLDEPNSNLDADGDAALTQAILSVRARGGICVVIAHRPAALTAVDQLLVLAHGQIQAVGPKDDVLRKVMQSVSPPAQVPGRFKVVTEGAPAHG